MKKKHFLYPLALATALIFTCSGTGHAQVTVVEEDVTVTDYVPGKVAYYENTFKDNWFISLGAGAQTFFTEHKGGDTQYTLAMNFAFGKWLTPAFGLRLGAVGGALHPMSAYEDGVMTHMRYVGVYGDLMWNMFNTFAGYNEKRVFSIIPFVGGGGALAFHNTQNHHKKTYAFPVTAGIKLNFRLNHYLDLFFEGRGNLLGDQFNGIVQGKQVESIVSLIGGFTIKFGSNRFIAYNPYGDRMIINDLNSRVNDLRSKLNACESRVVECPPCPEVEETVIVAEPDPCSQTLTSTVRFTIGSDVITPEEMVNVYNIAQWMNNNPSCSINVVGYADKDTGSAKLNMELSKRRAQAVVNSLVNKYKIDKNRINIIANGSDKQVYPDNNNWNRIVVFSTTANQ